MKRLGVQDKGRTATPSPTQPKVRADVVLLTVAVWPDGQEIAVQGAWVMVKP